MKYNLSVQEMVYSTLRKNILNLKLSPGTTMSTQEMATKLKVSRTPVREAFLRLEREGMLTVLPQRETMVSKINLKRTKQEQFMRASLEMAVLDPFIKNKDFDCLRQQNELIDKQMMAQMESKFEELIEHDDAFHRIFFVGAGQLLSWDTMESMSAHYRRFRLLTLWDKDIAKNIIMQHIELIRAVEAENLKKARSILQEHLHKVKIEEEQLVSNYPTYFDWEEEKELL